MFTGIIENTGEVTAVESTPDGGRISLRPAGGGVDTLAIGESVAVNGCCLTVTHAADGLLKFDLLRETLDVTNLGSLQAGGIVNLERALKLGDRLSGHMVQGHVDACGTISRIEPSGQDHILEIALPADHGGSLIPRGSITVDGISLTAARVEERAFTCYIIPHTWQVTRLHTLSPGDRVNLEFDMIGKYVAALLDYRKQG